MSHGFKDSLVYTKSADGRNFVLVEPLTYVSAAGETIVVPAGAHTDGASTPRILWRAIPPFGPYWPATILHDWLYRATKKSREECDDILLEAMRALDVSETLADTIYAGVRVGGQSAFDADRAAQPA